MTKSLQVILVAVALFAGLVSAEAQTAKKLWRIGYLSASTPAAESVRAEAIRLALRNLGYIEGQNIVTEYRHAEAKQDRVPELAAELVRLKVDIVVRPAMNATKTIPIVMMGVGADPVETGLVESLARPGGNVTGITLLSRELGGKRLELLKEAVPNVARIAVLYDPTIPGILREVKEDLPVAARALKLTIEPWEVRAVDDLDRVFAAVNRQRPGGLYLPGDRVVSAGNRHVDFSLKTRLPSMYQSGRAVEAGGLMSYGADRTDGYRQVAWYVDRILQGAKPADLPVQQPMKFEFLINLQTAKKIGVTINTDVLARATRIIR